MRYTRLPVESQARLTINPAIYEYKCKPDQITDLTRYLYNIKNSKNHNSKIIYLNIIN
uniref:Uncharacterized protein n=1 Tax=Porphyridium purpureum TaxID=35688 RepID=W0RYM1_PORPP|nr:hypothetical protein Y721_p167 [Porphyridium purpureum]ATJ02868.1 hypothetical protein [Porphyridium purpureum]BAO23641.1 hypothetical protein [Porphyridium purpureum]